MKDVTYSTGSEKRMFQAIQRAIGAYDNGVIGAQTMSDVAAVVKADCFPITLQIYGYPVIIGNDILAFDPNGGLKIYNNSLSGSFTYPSGQKPCSILVNKGQAVYSAACHAHIGKPESVLYRLDSGVFGVKKCRVRRIFQQMFAGLLVVWGCLVLMTLRERDLAVRTVMCCVRLIILCLQLRMTRFTVCTTKI